VSYGTTDLATTISDIVLDGVSEPLTAGEREMVAELLCESDRRGDGDTDGDVEIDGDARDDAL
jgi:hypothetical protein